MCRCRGGDVLFMVSQKASLLGKLGMSYHETSRHRLLFLLRHRIITCSKFGLAQESSLAVRGAGRSCCHFNNMATFGTAYLWIWATACQRPLARCFRASLDTFVRMCHSSLFQALETILPPIDLQVPSPCHVAFWNCHSKTAEHWRVTTSSGVHLRPLILFALRRSLGRFLFAAYHVCATSYSFVLWRKWDVTWFSRLLSMYWEWWIRPSVTCWCEVDTLHWCVELFVCVCSIWFAVRTRTRALKIFVRKEPRRWEPTQDRGKNTYPKNEWGAPTRTQNTVPAIDGWGKRAWREKATDRGSLWASCADVEVVRGARQIWTFRGLLPGTPCRCGVHVVD